MKPAIKTYLEEVVETLERRFALRRNAALRSGGKASARKQLWEQRLLVRAQQILEAEQARRMRGTQLRLPLDVPGQTYLPGTEPAPVGGLK